MNRNSIGSWLLALGTVLGAIAAANSHKSGKLVSLEGVDTLPGEFVLHDVTDGRVQLTAGTALTAEAIVLMTMAGLADVPVVVPSQPAGEGSGPRAPVGCVLAKEVGPPENPISAGTKLTVEGIASIERAGLRQVRVRVPSLPDEDGDDAEAEEPIDTDTLVGCTLAADLEFPRVVVVAGTELSPETVALIKGLGLEGVQIRVPSWPIEKVSGLDALVGRVLAKDVVLSTEPRLLEAGTKLSFSQLRELREGGIESLRIEGEARPVPVGAPGTFDRAGAVLSETIAFDFPTKIAAGSFLTEDHAQALLDAGIDPVRVRVPKQFIFADWDERLVFLLGVLLMLAGIAFKRVAASGGEDDKGEGATLGIREVRTRLEEVVRQAAALAERADDLTAAELHLAVDDILTQGCYQIVESRQAIAVALGQAGFAEVMSAFSSGERRLNRAWSAAVDEYPAEARLSVRESVPYLETALAALRPS